MRKRSNKQSHMVFLRASLTIPKKYSQEYGFASFPKHIRRLKTTTSPRIIFFSNSAGELHVISLR
jgi:hypothetical protein